jgi:hypothetical protein
MTVAELQKFLKNMSVVLKESSASGFATELVEFSEKLSGFKSQSLQEFGDFVKIAVRPPLPSKNPLLMLKELFDRALDPAMTAEAIKGKVGELSNLSLPDLKRLAKDFEISRTLKNKGEVLQAIAQRVIDRRASFDRSSV